MKFGLATVAVFAIRAGEWRLSRDSKTRRAPAKPDSIRRLRAVAARTTGEDVLREGARIYADYLRRRLVDLDDQDPDRDVVEDLAFRYHGLAG